MSAVGDLCGSVYKSVHDTFFNCGFHPYKTKPILIYNTLSEIHLMYNTNTNILKCALFMQY